MANNKILVAGSLNMDQIVRVPRIPALGETLLGAGSLKLVPGGKGTKLRRAAKHTNKARLKSGVRCGRPQARPAAHGRGNAGRRLMPCDTASAVFMPLS